MNFYNFCYFTWRVSYTPPHCAPVHTFCCGSLSLAVRTWMHAVRVHAPRTCPCRRQCNFSRRLEVSAQSNRPSESVRQLRITRRDLLVGTGCVIIPLAQPAHASLVRFPANELNNRYFLVRAGESAAEADDECLTNPVWKTSGRHGLSEVGKAQVLQSTAKVLENAGVAAEGGWIWPSITQNSYQTAEILAYSLGLGRSRIVPEYSFLDGRGLGALERLPLSRALEQVLQGDVQDPSWKPQPGTDGTPNESLQDLLVRVRQLLSITETQYFGTNIVVVAPDSDTLSVLQAGVLGRDLRSHTQFAFRPGQVRVLQLSDQSFDAQPRAFSCPDPPKCLGTGRPAKPFSLVP